MKIDRMLDKAERLISRGRVERIGEGIYNVIGDHGTYTVAQDPKGRISCNCPGFKERGICSHSTAVVMLNEIDKGLIRLRRRG